MKEYDDYSKFMEEYNDSLDFETILEYDNFKVVYDRKEHRYFYFECGENDASDFYEVNLLARLSPSNDMLSDGKDLHDLFPCDVCGEKIDDKGVATYFWFTVKK